MIPVVLAIGDQIVEAYSRICLNNLVTMVTIWVMALQVATIVSFCFPHFVEVSAFMSLSVFLALSDVLRICEL